ncbi:type IV toxin-antitoxin system AbiEi family antitoxin domain-containing protein [Flindersiella endophytica]
MNLLMRGSLAGLSMEQSGLFTRQQALESGYDSDEIRRLVDKGEWLRIRTGVYVEQGLWNMLSERARSLLRIRAAYVRVKQRGVISHWSAAVVWALDTYEADLSLLHLTRPDRHSSRKEAGIQHHVGRLDPTEIVQVDGLTVTSLARTVVDLACIAPPASGLVTADSALREGLTPEELLQQLERQQDNPGAIRAGHIVSRADGRSESPGESICRYVFEQLQLPAPELQVEFHDDAGRLLARTDFAWPARRVVAEFDGKRKYYRDLKDGEDPGDVVWREKRREDGVRRAHGVDVVRIVWSNLYPDQWSALKQMMRRALGL